MREEEDARPLACAGCEAGDVEGGEPGLAEAGGEHDEGASASLLACLRQGEKRLFLELVGCGRRVEGLGVGVAGWQGAGGLSHALGVGVDPLLGQVDRGRPEGVDGGVDAGVAGGVDGSLDPEVPLDAGLERGAREVAAADEGDAEARRLEEALRMKRTFGAVWPRGFDHADAELAATGRIWRFVTGMAVA